MKLLVLLAVLGAVSAQYQVYTGGVTPFHAGYTPYHSTYAVQPAAYAAHPATYAAYPGTYAAHPATYAAYPGTYAVHPYVSGLPFSFKPAEEKTVEEAKPVVESRSKRSADEDQKAEEATFVSTYAAHPYPLTHTAGYHVPSVYNAGYPYNAYSAPTVYRSAYSPLAYGGLYNGAYHSYGAPVVHSLKKRDTAAAEEDQQADEATFYSTYASHPLTYNAGYPYTAFNGGASYHVPSVYNAAPAIPYSGFSYNLPYTYRKFY